MSEMLPRVSQTVHIDDCWNRIGVSGDASCPLLSAHIHCRNCPTYADASRKLLDRMPVDLEATGPAAPRHGTYGIDRYNDENGALARRAFQVQVLVFRLEAEWLALPVSGIEEVAPIRPIHSLPHRRGNALLGVVNVRGTLLSCLSLKTILNVETTHQPAVHATSRLLILTTREASLATVVDEIDGIYGLDSATLVGVPSTLARATVKHASGWGTCGKHQVGLLDLDAIRTAMQRGMQ